MHKVITMSDSNYFNCGKLFIKTRSKINADFVLYGPDLSTSQIDILERNNIEYIEVDDHRYKTEMQALKFEFVLNQIVADKYKKYSGFTLADFDTFFINDWEKIFNYNFDYGITVKNRLNKDRLWSYANGGVVFSKHSSKPLLEFAKNIILRGRDLKLPEYDRIWNTLENGRPEHKTHYRTTLRWWVDQVFLCALALRHAADKKRYNMGVEPVIFDFNNINIGLFSCTYYNVLESQPKITEEKNIYIRHLKTTGRKALGVDKTKEKI